jgi:hypothetical protein
MNENSMKSCMIVVLVPARMPACSGRHMAALVPLKGLGCLEAVERDCLHPVHN